MTHFSVQKPFLPGLFLTILGACHGLAQQAGSLPASLSLSQAEELLFQKNLAVLTSRQQVELASTLRAIANLKPNPTLQLGAEQFAWTSPVPGRVTQPLATNSNAGANPVTTIQYGRTIERGGKRELRTQQAEALMDTAKAQVLDTFRQQLFLLRQAFTVALLAKENLKLAEEIDAQYHETEGLMEIRFKSGDIAGVDLDRVRAARLPYQQVVLDSRALYWQATRDIAGLLGTSELINMRLGSMNAPGMDAAPVVEIQGKLDIPAVAETADALRQSALKTRPDLEAARSNIRAAERGVRLAEAQLRRDIYTAVEYQRVGSDNSAGVILSFPLFVYNNQKAGIAQAEAQQRLAALQLRLAETQTLTDVDKAYQAVQAARRALDLYNQETIDRLNSIRNTVVYSYRKGEASLLEVLDAQRSVSQTLLFYNQAKANYQTAVWQLESALGRTR